MSMTTTLTLAYEGAPACGDCQRAGVPVCSHVGFHDSAWAYIPEQAVSVPGLDSAFTHVVREVEISSDRKTVTLTVDTERPSMLELARHLSTYTDGRAKAKVRAVHHETGDVLAEGVYDAFLRVGQEVWANGVPCRVQGVEHPNRGPYGTCVDGLPDVQVATLVPVESSPVSFENGLDFSELLKAGGRSHDAAGASA